MQCKARRAAQGGPLSKRRNAAMRCPDRLPEGFAPESLLNSVALFANRTTIRFVARLASNDSGVNADSPILRNEF
jgi:hypothetical protein